MCLGEKKKTLLPQKNPHLRLAQSALGCQAGSHIVSPWTKSSWPKSDLVEEPRIRTNVGQERVRLSHEQFVPLIGWYIGDDTWLAHLFKHLVRKQMHLGIETGAAEEDLN